MDKSNPAVDYADGEILTEANLDRSNDQLLNAIHELFDGFLPSIQGDLELLGSLEMNGGGITGMAKGLAANSAVTLAQLEDVAFTGATSILRVIRATSIAEIETYSAPVGYVFSLNAGGRSGTFDVIAGDFSTELAADTENGIYIGLADNPTATTKVAKRRLNGSIFVNWFGAEAGGFDCKPAFLAVADYIQSKGGNTILEFAPSEGTYFYSQSKPAGDPSFYGNGSFFNFTDVDGVVIKGNKAKVALADGVHFGSFDPITGVASPTIQTNGDYSNGGGSFIRFTNSTNCYVENIVWDGNAINHIVGGQFGDTGYQIVEYGLILSGTCKNFTARDCEFNNSGLDGVAVGVSNPSNYENYNVSFYNIKSEYNGRQGVSLTGSSGMLFQNCSFSHTGKGAISSSPGSGLDIEPEGGRSVLNNTFISCAFHNNSGAAVVADSTINNTGNLFINCSLIGTTETVIYSRTVLTFNDCYIKGAVTVTGSSIFNDCEFDDEATTEYPAIFNGGSYYFNSTVAPIFNRCTIRRTQATPLIYYRPSFNNTKVIFEFNSDNYTSSAPLLGYTSGASIGGNLYCYDRMTGSTLLALGSYSADNGTLILAEDNGHVAPQAYGTGRDWGSNQYSAQGPVATSALRIAADRQVNLAADSGPTEITVSNQLAIPNGTYQDGDIVFKSATSAGNFIGWTCVTGGVQGSTAVFKQFGSIEA